MANVIPAQPGWRLCCWVREHGHAMALPIVAWQEVDDGQGTGGTRLEPFVLSWEGSHVGPLSKYDWFVGIIPPDGELADYLEAAEDVAKAEEAAEDREYERSQKASA